VVTVDGDSVYLGVIESPAYWAESDIVEASRRREVAWSNPNEPVHRAQLPARVFAKLRSLLTVTDLTDVLPDLDSLVIGVEGSRKGEPGALRLPRATKELAAELHLPLDWLDGIIEDLEEKRQLIFYGPPGTSKTYVARALADHLVTQPSNTMLVQFHPSYTYEDFFEGFRPRPAAEGTISFELVPGPLRRLAAAAHADPDTPYVLVIDEINRANLAKVFGELYFLLEYREDAVTLQYSPEGTTFSLPRNLYVIGTMNTADRSIARVDAAMRRRFWFVEFFPNRPPVDGLLRQWLIDEGRPTAPADLLQVLNDRIGDPDFAVGPSYLMSDRSATPEGLRSIWARAVIPLLEEHYYGSSTDVEARFGLDALRASLQASNDTGPVDTLEQGADEELP
jgi:5-methylcytosine-specific restriction protein B